jgi:Carboxypeptidase regulatory-like domain/TonB-dependent Receptor Plug Domain
MSRKPQPTFILIIILLISLTIAYGQSTTGSISGTVEDEKASIIPNASVSVRNTDTGFARTVQTDSEGRYRFTNLPIGAYQITVEAPNFGKFVQSGIILVVNQDAVIGVTLKAGSVQETVTITENASVLNTTTAEVSTRFDEKRLSELPVATNRSVMNVLLSVPGVSQLGSGQTGFSSGISFSANGGRVRSNNFMLDGQDVNNSSVAGATVSLNNPDAIQEVRIVTNQFLPEFGRNSGSVVNFIGKSGTNEFHGTAFWFHNNKKLNACSNTEKASGFCNPAATDLAKQVAPFRLENQFGFTFGGPLHLPAFGEGGPYFTNGKDRTFFFGDLQRWTDRQLGAGATVNGAPTDAGKQILQTAAGGRPQVAALLKFLPAGTANGTSKTVTINGTSYVIPLGNLTGTSSIRFNDNQGSIRIDHRINDRNFIYGRYRFDDQISNGSGQVTPSGLTTVASSNSKVATIVLNSVLTNSISNEFRVAYQRYRENTSASNPLAETIPSLEVADLGLSGFNAGASRTAIGLAVNLPQFSTRNTYQIQDNLSYTTGNHNLKFGVDLRYWQQKSFFYPTVRGRLAYTTLQNLIDDVAQTATINRPLAGGDLIQFYKWTEFFTYAQDQWKITPTFTLSYGVRYEYPGDSFTYLKELNKRVVAANGNDPRYIYTPQPKADLNNFMPRIGFNWNPRTDKEGLIGFFTGGDKLVIRGGYARTYDASFLNINLNVATASPFVASVNTSLTSAFTTIQNFTNPTGLNPLLLNKTVVGGDFRAPSTDQYSFEMQRELTRDTVFKASYIATRGTGLFQTIDGNPRTLCGSGTSANPCPRADPTLGVIRLRANAASSIYHSLQTSFDKRLSKNFSAGVHYTWSSFIDTATEIFNPSSAEVAVSQDSFNRNGDRSRSSYDRPHRLTGNIVYELPFYTSQDGFVGRVLGGWQVNSFLSFQSGAPFTVLNGSDPAGALSGIDGLVGNAIRPNLNTSLDLSSMTILDIIRAGGSSLFKTITAAQRVGNAGRNILRADGIQQIDFGVIKNTRISEKVRFQIRADMFNAINHRNFGIPNATVTAGANFLNQWATNGGNRRIIVGGRLVF